MAIEKWVVNPGETRVIDLELVRKLKVSLIGGKVDVIAHDEPGARVEVSSVTGKDLMIQIDGDSLEAHSLAGQLMGTLGGLGVATFLGYLVASALFSWRALRQRWRATDPWNRAVRGLAAVVLFELVLLLVAGLSGHNLERANWVWMPALIVAAVACKPESVLDEPEPEVVRVFE